MQIIKPITVDLQKPNAPLIVNAKQNDKATRYIYATLIDGSSPYTIDASAVAEFRAKKPDGTGAFYDATISGNIVQCELKEQVLTVAGDVKAEINLYTATGSKLTSFAFTVKVEESVLEDATIVSSDYFNALTETTAEILRTATMIKPLGYYATVAALQAAVTSPNAGDMYGVGSAEPYDFYTWDAINSEWVNNGQIKGQKGDAGVSVTVGTTTTGAAGTQASVSNGGTASDAVLNFTIPQGATGAGVPDGGTDGQIIVKSGVSAVWQDQNTVDGIAAIDGNIPLSAARQYSTMPTVTTADNGTIAQYIGTDETTYKTGHWYEVVSGAWQEIVYGDPNSVSYDAQSKTVTQKAQARTNIGAANSDVFSRGNETALAAGIKGVDIKSFAASGDDPAGVSLGIGTGAPDTVNNVEVGASLKSPFRDAIIPVENINSKITLNDSANFSLTITRGNKQGNICSLIVLVLVKNALTANTVYTPVSIASDIVPPINMAYSQVAITSGGAFICPVSCNIYNQAGSTGDLKFSPSASVAANNYVALSITYICA